MKLCRVESRLTVPVAVVALFSLTLLMGAQPPDPPKASSFAPAKELMSLVDYYVGRLESALAPGEDYDEADKSRVTKDANLLIVLLMAAGMHDEDNPLKASAPALVERAQKLFDSAADAEQARAALAALSDGMKQGAAGGEPLKWEKRYKLGQLMKQVTTINGGLRRGVRKTRFEKDAEKSAEYAAALGVIAQATLVDTHEVKDPANLGDWYRLSAEWRDTAGEVGRAIREGNYEATDQALKKMTKSCDDCHAVFRPEGI